MKRCRLIYRSVAQPEAVEPEGMREIVERSQRNNETAGIDGLLVLTGGEFLQVLEGPVTFVNELYGRILGDPRHHRIQLIAYDRIDQGLFLDWRMLAVELDELDEATRGMLGSKYDVRDGQIAVPDDVMQVYGLLLDAQVIARRKRS